MGQSDWIGLIVALIIAGIGAVMTTFGRTTIRVIGICLVLLGIGGAALLHFGYLQLADAQSPTPQSPTSTVTAPNNQGIVTQGQTGGTNIVNPPSAGSVGDDSVVMGRVAPGSNVGNRSVVIGPTDDKGNTKLGPMIVGHGACGKPGDTVIGADAGSCPKP